MDKIPKIDLHCHLDGSIPFAFVKKVCPLSNRQTGAEAFTLERNAVRCSFADASTKRMLNKMLDEEDKKYGQCAQ